MVDYYDWIKVGHVLAVISWMAAQLYLPRLFVYHSQVKPGSEASELFKVMERRLLTAIMTPAMIAAWIFGLWLIWLGGHSGPWLWIKLAAVLVMSGFHGWLAKCAKAFAAGERPRSERFFRVANEVPALLMIVIVVMVIVKPFS